MAENLAISDKKCYNITQQQSPEFQWNMGPAKRGNCTTFTEYKSAKKRMSSFFATHAVDIADTFMQIMQK